MYLLGSLSSDVVVPRTATIGSCMEAIDKNGFGGCVVVDEVALERTIGILTDGDIRRLILRGISIQEVVGKYVSRDFAYVEGPKNSAERDALKIARKLGKSFVPWLDADRLIGVWISKRGEKSNLRPIPAVLVLAGGRGSR